MASNSSSSADNNFGPAVKGFRGNFDFTLLFEDAFFALVPSAILLILAPLRTLWLWTSPRKVTQNSERLNKVAFLAGFAVLELTLLLLWATNNDWDTNLSIPASAIDFAAACGLFVLSYFEHSRTVRPSLLINLYLALSLPFDIARTRTLWLIKDFRHMAIVQTVSVAIKTGVLILEAISKRKILLAPYQDLPPEATSGVFSRGVFWWLTPIFRLGFKKNLELKDLDSLDPSLQSAGLHKIFEEKWAKANKSRKHALFYTTFSAVWLPILYGALPRILLIGFKYAQPFLLNRTTKFVSSDEGEDVGWGLVGAYALVYSGLAVLTAAYTHLQNRSITMIRGGLVAMIYSKTVELSINAVDESSSMTLMSSDIERITQSLMFMHDTWAALIEIGIAIFLLQQSIGIACVAPAFISLAVTSATAWVTQYMIPAQRIWVECIQTRIAFTSRMLGAMRSIKLLGLVNVVEKLTQGLRDVEVLGAQKFRYFFSFRIMATNLPSILAPLATFSVFVIIAAKTGVTLNTAEAYTALSIIALMEDPLAMLLMSYSAIMSSFACYDRIQAYLEGPSRFDHRIGMSGLERRATHASVRDIGDSGAGIELQRLSTVSKTVTEDVLVVQDASFGWSADKPSVLHDINFRIRDGSFTMIIGPVGVGKSTLMKGILGETNSAKGFVYTSSLAIALADQNCWIRNCTLQENILGLSNYDRDWYENVVECCGLQDDVDIMPNGDQTVVGSGGISLSGGQKQRVALARAVYSKEDIIMLDDVFSGLDAESEELIFEKVFGPTGIVRKSRTTVILITHAVHRLSYSDHIIALNDGTIVEQGTFETLRTAGGYVQAVAHKTKEHKRKSASSGEKKPRLTKPPRDQKLDEAAEDLARRTGDWSVYKYYTKESGYLAMLAFLWCCIIYSIALKSPELLIKFWAEAVDKQGNRVNTFYILLDTGLGVLSFIMIMASVWIYILKIIPKTSTKLHARLLRTVMKAPLSFFTQTDTGSLTSRFSQDLAIVDYELPLAAIQTTFMIFFVLMMFALMLLSAGEFAATVPFLAATLWAIQKIYLRTSRQIRLLDLEAKAPLFSQFGETLSGLATVRAFGWAERFREHNLKLLDDSQKPFYILFCIQRWLAVVLDLVVAGLAVVLMILVVFLRTKLNPGFVALALLNIMSFNAVLASLIKSYTQLETSIGAISRIRSFVNDTAQEIKPEEDLEPPANWPHEGAIEIHKFTAAYQATGKSVLSNVNLTILSGEKVGVCGRSGSGKSSLLSSLLHILEYQDGVITIDNVDLSFIPRNTLRQRINVIPQDPFFIKGTFRLNMNPWEEDSEVSTIPTDEKAIEALQKVEIWETVEKRGGLDAEMENDSLSLGQKQLFCLARALLRKSRVIVLDEVTSSVDVKTDELMQRIIRSEFAGCTIIAVAHRLNTIVDFDKIAVLGAGKLLEYDTPERLLNREEGSAFRELYET